MILDENFEEEFVEAIPNGLNNSLNDQPAPLVLTADDQANKSLRAVAFWEKERAAIVAQANTEIDRLRAWMDTETERIDRRIMWHQQGLTAFMLASGKKTLRMAYGTLKRIAGRESVEVEDETVFFDWVGSLPESVQAEFSLVRTKYSPDKKAIMSYVQQVGEEPPGVEVVTGEDTVTITVEG